MATASFEEGLKRGMALVFWLHEYLKRATPADARNAPELTPTQWYVSGKLLDSALME